MDEVCIIGASGKLGRYMVQHALDHGYEVVAVCRQKSVEKLAAFGEQITIVPGTTNDPEVIKRAVAGCDGVLTVLVFSCGWHITKDGKDVCWSTRHRPLLAASPQARLRLDRVIQILLSESTRQSLRVRIIDA